MSTSICDVSAFVLETKGRMTTMKLQKLCYYIQAWHLAENRKPLFSEDFEAWANGPVSKELYGIHRGKYAIGVLDFKDLGNSKNISKEIQDFILRIISIYEPLTADQLSSLTHEQYPWKNARKGIPEGVYSSNVIPKSSIEEYYASLEENYEAMSISKIKWPQYLLSSI